MHLFERSGTDPGTSGRLAGLVLLSVVLCGAPATRAADPPPPPTAASEDEPEAPPWLAPLRDREGRVSWRSIAIGMEMREVASLLRVPLQTDLVMEVGCGGDALEIVVDGVKLLMAFEGHTRNAKLHTLFVFVDPPIDANEAVATLKRRLPKLVSDGGIDDPRPAYRLGDPAVAIIVDPRGLWLSDPMCVDP